MLKTFVYSYCIFIFCGNHDTVLVKSLVQDKKQTKKKLLLSKCDSKDINNVTNVFLFDP